MDLNVPNWDEYFMAIAGMVAVRSKDPSTKVGSVLVDKNNRIVGTGYNGMPPGIPQGEEEKLWVKPLKYEYVIHAEANALLHSNVSPKGCTLYVTLFPCHSCAKLVASSGVSRVVYRDDREDEITRNIFRLANVRLEKLCIN